MDTTHATPLANPSPATATAPPNTPLHSISSDFMEGFMQCIDPSERHGFAGMMEGFFRNNPTLAKVTSDDVMKSLQRRSDSTSS